MFSVHRALQGMTKCDSPSKWVMHLQCHRAIVRKGAMYHPTRLRSSRNFTGPNTGQSSIQAILAVIART